jgi:hypothetical protein
VPVVADLLEAQEYIMSMEDQIAISWWLKTWHAVKSITAKWHNCYQIQWMQK